MLKSKNIMSNFFSCLTSLSEGEGMRVRLFIFLFLFSSCSVSKQISKQANTFLLQDSAIMQGHIGISIYEPATGKVRYNYQAEKYYVPASNTKLVSLYAGMKYLGDSLVGLKVTEYSDHIFVTTTGDPTLLQEDFKNQPVYDFLKQPTSKPIWSVTPAWLENTLGYGWSWDDYNSSDMAERSPIPVFGDLMHFSGIKTDINYYPKRVVTNNNFSIYSKNGAIGYIDNVTRDFRQNNFILNIDGKELKQIKIPFITSDALNAQLLIDSLHTKNYIVLPGSAPPILLDQNSKKFIVHSQ